MSGYVEFTLPDGSQVIIESDDTTTGITKAGTGDVIQKAQETFENAIENSRKAALVVLNKVKDLTQEPDQVEITFGLKASGEVGGLVVAKAGIEASYSVKLMWKKVENKSSGSKS